MDCRNIIEFHNPEEEYGFLSNWYLSDFQVKGIFYSSMEQYMMHQKALLFGDTETAERILATDQVAEIKNLGRTVKDYNESVWSGRRQIIVYRGLLEKFRQNPELQQALLSTGNAVLAECAVKDRIWGIGLSMRDENRFQQENWKGQNLLGYTLMEVREQILGGWTL